MKNMATTRRSSPRPEALLRSNHFRPTSERSPWPGDCRVPDENKTSRPDRQTDKQTDKTTIVEPRAEVQARTVKRRLPHPAGTRSPADPRLGRVTGHVTTCGQCDSRRPRSGRVGAGPVGIETLVGGTVQCGASV